jgi:hypothetical protein
LQAWTTFTSRCEKTKRETSESDYMKGPLIIVAVGSIYACDAAGLYFLSNKGILRQARHLTDPSSRLMLPDILNSLMIQRYSFTPLSISWIVNNLTWVMVRSSKVRWPIGAQKHMENLMFTGPSKTVMECEQEQYSKRCIMIHLLKQCRAVYTSNRDDKVLTYVIKSSVACTATSIVGGSCSQKRIQVIYARESDTSTLFPRIS